MCKRLLPLLVLQVVICSFRSVACTFTATTNGNWTTTTIWSRTGTGCIAGSLPGANDDVIIGAQIRVTLNVNASVKSLILNAGFNPANSTDLTVTGNITLAINGNMTLNNHSNLIINNGAAVRGTGSICATNNGNVDVESNTGGGSFYVANCLSTASGCSNNSNFINASGLTYCVACRTTGSGNQGQSAGGCVALPVQLVSFMGAFEATTNRVKLFWQTSWEKDNDYFSVQRSIDGTNFEEITRVAGHGTVTGISTYQAYDNDPVGSVVYYRLKQVDLDEQYEYSPVISITLPATVSSFEVYPNPLNGNELTLRFASSAISVNARIHIFNVMGQELQFQKYEGENSVISITIPDKKPAGIYLLSVELPTRTFVKQITML